ncbi:MAG: hypothetical protein Q8R28_18110 [Dehalococcoidia bacterium]|nr:hypothetical protein [Dehalococcoidia bacterium]
MPKRYFINQRTNQYEALDEGDGPDAPNALLHAGFEEVTEEEWDQYKQEVPSSERSSLSFDEQDEFVRYYLATQGGQSGGGDVPFGPGQFQEALTSRQRSPFYQEQLPDQAFTRYLAERQGTPTFGTPARSALETRGRLTGALAPLFGYGIGEDLGGQGQDFLPYFQRYGVGAPSFGDTSEQLRGILQTLQNSDAASLAFLGDVPEGIDPAEYYGILLGGGNITQSQIQAIPYQNQGRQAEAVGANLGLRLNPYFRSGLNSYLGRQFEQQQAIAPEQHFLEYAQQRGFF